MYPFWNPYIMPCYVNFPVQYPYVNQPIYAFPSHQINSGYVLQQQIQSQPQNTKNNQRTTEQSPIEVIQISDSQEMQRQLVHQPRNNEIKNQKNLKLKGNRHLGFKEGIFENKEQNQKQLPKFVQNKALITRSSLRRNKQKYKKKYKKQKILLVQLNERPRRSISRLNLRRKQKVKAQTQKVDQKKQKKKFINRLKKKMQRVQKTVQIKKMYILQGNLQEIIANKREDLYSRKICNDDII